MVWQFFRGMPIVAQLIVGLLALPLVAGLWIRESALPMWLQVMLVIGLGIAVIYTFFPKQS
jgi:hypothetical protein